MITIYLTILTAVSILAPFVVQAIKKILGSREYNVDILAMCVTALIALISCISYMVVYAVPPTPTNIIYVLGTVFFSVLGSLCGYDKVFSVIFEIFKER